MCYYYTSKTEDDKTLWEDEQIYESTTEHILYEKVNSFRMIEVTVTDSSESRRVPVCGWYLYEAPVFHYTFIDLLNIWWKKVWMYSRWYCDFLNL